MSHELYELSSHSFYILISDLQYNVMSKSVSIIL